MRRPSLRAYVVPLAMLAMLTAGCSSSGGSAAGPDNSRVSVAGAEPENSRVSAAGASVKLDGVRFDVRRDPG